MSSAAKRLAGVFSRIAEERVARGRSPTSSRPKVAHSYSTTVITDPADTGQGSEAELAEMIVSPPIPKPFGISVGSTAATLMLENGQPFRTSIVTEVHGQEVDVQLIKGIDYAEIVNN